jgi:signal peptidase I
MMGDNRDSSRDSRYWGTVPRSLIKGRAFLIWWSYREDPNDYRENVGWRRLVAIAKKIPRLPSHTRWERLFSLVR